MAEQGAVDAQERIEAVAERAQKEQDGIGAAARTFVHHYYRWVPEADLAARDGRDLYGAAMAHWNLAKQRDPEQTKVAIYNPDPERDGWSSPHTALEIVSDDMPFLVDSVTMAVSSLGYDPHLVIHPMIRVERDDDGRLTGVVDDANGSGDDAGGRRESFIHVELDREEDPARLEALGARIERTLADVRNAVRDWQPMRNRAIELADELPDREAGEFLRWLAHDHFTFLGYREYTLGPVSGSGPECLRAVEDTGLGILAGPPRTPVTELRPQAAKLAQSEDPLVLTKANSRSTVHRPAYLDYVGVKKFDEDGAGVIGERRFLGLFATSAYREPVSEIPLIRGKVESVLRRSSFPPDSHDFKLLKEICETHPRDALFQMTADQLLEIAVGILGLGERQQVRVFTRVDPLGRFVDCTICMPRDRYNRDTRTRAAKVLLEHFGGSHFDWTLQIGESRVAQVHLLVHTPDGPAGDADSSALQERITAAIRSWSEDLRDLLLDAHEDRKGRALAARYGDAFPPAYQERWSAVDALADIETLERLAASSAPEPVLKLYRAPDDGVGAKLISPAPVSLSAALDIFANLGARVIDEQPNEVHPADGPPMWIYDFGMHCRVEDLDSVGPRFEELFAAVWRGDLENDGLGELVLEAGLNARQIVVLRAISKYLRQAGIPFSDRYVESTLIANPHAAGLLIALFEARHDPQKVNDVDPDAIEAELKEAIDAVRSLDEDRILRAYRSVVRAILRTNHYQHGADSAAKPYLSLKLDSSAIPILPYPRPKFEIFVYSPRVEGVHLRGGAVARGGLRWSDRRDDFRTEILGLAKAQMVKNALIVPVGSKGGFVVKRPPEDDSREAQQAEAIACYRTFLSGLLDLTDNIVDSEVVPPPNVVRYDGDDTYLVVAADKGTATFSDIANSVSEEYGFWLGDAFASGGSVGYDHKAMGITARGAWESVKRHFRELGHDIQREDFTVVGIGDMAGDVFGNGMLLSEHIRLIAAFNHRHIFIDPNPDAAASFAERKRLFELPRSNWSDYSRELISEGGGIFERTAKEIQLSPQIREALDIEDSSLTPSDLISAILKAPVDLLWNGGIGTYVKAGSESKQDVGDRANDALRVNGSELRARVVGEGGNLGFTQRGRIEYAKAGGRINTDAIDNVAGVNCSDHEVNIKILLDSAVTAGDLSRDDRNALLAEMTDAVAERVLAGSYRQSQALSLAHAQAKPMANVHARLIRDLESHAGLDRAIEFLPSEQELCERGLTAPELAVVMAYCKIHLDAQLLGSDLPEDPHLAGDLEHYFPAPLPERFHEFLTEHRLRREIIATTVANEVVDRQGTSFNFRLGEETGAAPALLARAFAVARDVYAMREFWSAVEGLDNEVDAEVQLEMLQAGRKLVERATRWLVRSYPESIDISSLSERYRPAAELLWETGPEHLDDDDQELFRKLTEGLTGRGVPEPLARQVATMERMVGAFDTVEVAEDTDHPLEDVVVASRELGSELSLFWLQRRITELPRDDRWQSLARDALRDDLTTLHRTLTSQRLAGRGFDPVSLERYLSVLADIRESGDYNTTTLPVALRELRNLVC